VARETNGNTWGRGAVGTAVERQVSSALGARIEATKARGSRRRRRRGGRVWGGVCPSPSGEGMGPQKMFSIFELKKVSFVHSGCYFCR